MSVTSLKTLRAQIAESGSTLGNTGHFSESVTFRPASGPERTIAAACVYNRDDDVYEEVSEREEEELTVQVPQSETCTRGGIATPEIGDSLLRESDPPDAPWSFHRVSKDLGHSWVLVFRRRRPRRYGPMQQ